MCVRERERDTERDGEERTEKCVLLVRCARERRSVCERSQMGKNGEGSEWEGGGSEREGGEIEAPVTARMKVSGGLEKRQEEEEATKRMNICKKGRYVGFPEDA